MLHNVPTTILYRNEMVTKAEAADATIPHPASDYGFMYQHSFADLDGHHWEFMWMDPNGMPEHPGEQVEPDQL